MDTLSTYAKHFMGILEKPEVESITGLSPIIAIEQKTTGSNPRSTVGTITEISDFLRLLYARASTAYSPVTGKEMVRYTDARIVDLIMSGYAGRKCLLLSPLVRGRKGHYRELFDQMRRKGYLQVRVDDEILELESGMRVDRYKNHNIEVVIDKLAVKESDEERLRNTIRIAMRQGDGLIMIYDKDAEEVKYFSRRLMCPTTGLSY